MSQDDQWTCKQIQQLINVGRLLQSFILSYISAHLLSIFQKIHFSLRSWYSVQHLTPKEEFVLSFPLDAWLWGSGCVSELLILQVFTAYSELWHTSSIHVFCRNQQHKHAEERSSVEVCFSYYVLHLDGATGAWTSIAVWPRKMTVAICRKHIHTDTCTDTTTKLWKLFQTVCPLSSPVLISHYLLRHCTTSQYII